MSLISGQLTLSCVEFKKKGILFDKSLTITSNNIKMDIDFLNDLKLIKITEPKYFIATAKFIDDKTLEECEASIGFSIDLSDFSVQIVNSPNNFKVGLPCTLILNFKNLGIVKKSTPAKILIKDQDDTKIFSKELELHEKSQFIRIETSTIENDTTSISARIIVDGILYSMKIFKYQSLTNENIVLNLLTPL